METVSNEDDRPEVNLFAGPPVLPTPDAEPPQGVPAVPLSDISTLEKMSGESAFSIAIGLPQLPPLSSESQAEIAEIRARFRRAIEKVDEWRHEIISRMWDNYQKTLEEIASRKEQIDKELHVHADSLEYHEVKEEIEQLGALAQKILMDYAALSISFQISSAEVREDPERISGIYQMAVGQLVLQELDNPAFTDRVYNSLVARLDNHFKSPLAELEGAEKEERLQMTDKWMLFVKAKMAFVAVAAFVDTGTLQGRMDLTARDVLDLPNIGPDGEAAREALQKIADDLGEYITEEEVAKYLDDVASSVFSTSSSHNAINQVMAFIGIFDDESDGGVHRLHRA